MSSIDNFSPSSFSSATMTPTISDSGSPADLNKRLPYACAVCGKSWSVRSKLEIHIRTHTGSKPFPCDLCGRDFNVLSNLRRHQRTVHSASKPFMCGVCGKTFNQNSNLKRHEVIHTWSAELGPTSAYTIIPPMNLDDTEEDIPIPQPVRTFSPTFSQFSPRLDFKTPISSPRISAFVPVEKH
jgi:uncharacterized Zn-finger protein